jgi:hypothetical protein
MALLVRRNPAPVHTRYQTYKRYLREDFQYRCVYCDIHENEYGGLHHFHVEHFRPHSLPQFALLKTVYGNLLYACGICNKRKGNDWPSDDPINNGRGYLNPCEHDYETHFCPDPAKAHHVQGISDAAKYMALRLRFNRRQLVLMRQRREEKRQRYEQSMLAVNAALDAVDKAIQRHGPGADPAWLDLQASLVAERDVIEAEWTARWTPELEAEDYR